HRLRKFQIVLELDLLERVRRRLGLDRHVVGQFQHFAIGPWRAHLFLGRGLVETVQQRIDVVLAVARSRWRRRGRWRRYRFCGGGRRRNLRRRNVGHRRRLGGGRTRRGSSRLLGVRWCRRRGGRGGLVGARRRLGFVIGDDAPYRRQNLLHGGFLDLRRLRHLRLQIINALACVSLTPSA